MTTPSEGIAAILDDTNVGNIAPATPWPIFEGQFPAETQECILLREPGGRQPEVRIAIDYPGMQILTRSNKDGYVSARAKIDEIFRTLQGIPSAPAAYPELTSAVAVSSPTFVGYDENDLPVWSLNFNLITTKDTEGYRDL